MQQLFSRQIRFRDGQGKDYPEWEKKQFLEVFKTQPTRRHQIKSSEILVDGLYRVVDQSKTLVAGHSNANEKLFSVTEGVIVYGDHTTVVQYVDFDFIVGADGIKILYSPMGQINKFLYYCLVFFNVSAEGYKRHFSILKQIFLPIPSIEEQQKIASFLSSVDRKIELISEQIERTREFKKGLLQQMFV